MSADKVERARGSRRGRILAIVAKIVDAERRGGGFRAYHDVAVDELCEIAEEGRK